MVNARQKGKRIERYFKNKLMPIFPDIQRNANEQSRGGGVDLINTDPFHFEVKGGSTLKTATYSFLKRSLKQLRDESDMTKLKALLIKGDNDEPMVVMDFEEFVLMAMIVRSEDIRRALTSK